MLNTHFLNTANPGSYEKELNKGLKANNLPTIKVPTMPDSTKILKAFMPEVKQTEEEGGDDEGEEMEENEERVEEEKVEIEPDNQTLTGKEIGLKIYSPNS